MSLVSVELLDKDLWKKFCNVTNEMIVTKSGRRMFPVVKVRVRGLNPKQFYQIKLEFVQIGNNRWKYMSGGWTTGGKAESPPGQSIYRHPDSPNLGNFWMKEEGILFSKVKLTNKPNPVNDQVVLNSLHKYQPVVLITEMDKESEETYTYKFDFPGAEFIAVTAYQNDEVTNLKIKHNPFAKAFQDTRERPLDVLCYPTSNPNLASLAHLNSNLGSLGNGNNNLLGSSVSNGSLVVSSTTNNNNSVNALGYLDRVPGKCSPNSLSNSLTNSTGSPNSNNSPSNLLSSGNCYANGLCNTSVASTANAYTAATTHGYLTASAAAAVSQLGNSRSTPTTFPMNGYYCNQSTAYQELSSTYHNLQSPETMVSSNNSPPITNYNLILNSQTNNQNNATNLTTNNQCTISSSGLIEPLTTVNTSSNNSNNSPTNDTNFLINTIKTSNSPITNLPSPSAANLSSSSSSSTSSLSSNPYCERYTPLKSHRTLPYTNIKSAVVGHPVTYSAYHNMYGTWNQQSNDLNWTLTPEGHYYSSVNL